MKIAIIKPDYHIHGGFEVVMDRIITGLKQHGHSVKYIKVDMTKPRYQLGEMAIPPEIYHKNEEFFRYTMSMEAFLELDLKKFDIVISTQPPSFAVDHPKVVALFYHHHKLFYDLFDAFIECGLGSIEHKSAMEVLREIDSYYITDDKYYIAGSEHVANRLRQYNNIKSHLYTFAAGIDDEYYQYNGPISFNSPICVGRHEFPKRPELFIHAMKHVDGLTGKIIGEGGKTPDLKVIDQYLTQLHHDKSDIDDENLWKSLVFNTKNLDISKLPTKKSDVIFMGRLSHNALIDEYANALCVVCPAYEEDYGLTAIEAMAFKKPVIVCNDGGGLAEFIENGVNGFIVEPKGEAIAEAINYLKTHPKDLKRMSDNAYTFSRQYSWEKAMDHFNQILDVIIGDIPQQ